MIFKPMILGSKGWGFAKKICKFDRNWIENKRDAWNGKVEETVARIPLIPTKSRVGENVQIIVTLSCRYRIGALSSWKSKSV